MSLSFTDQYLKRLLLPVLLLATLFTAGASAEWYEESQAIMGTEVSVELWHEDAATAQKAINAVMTEMHAINQWLSPWVISSELSRVNSRAAGEEVHISSDFAALLSRSFEISQRSDGAFDVTFASLGNLYDFRNGARPDEQQTADLLPALDYRQVQLNPHKQTVRYTHPKTAIDFGGIAKGYAVDRCLSILRDLGIRHAVVSAGGDSGFLGDRRGRDWMVGIRHPRQSDTSVIHLPMANAAMSTSGDYERFFDENGTRYHHMLIPESGDSARAVVSVTVLGPETTITDALSTTLFVLGPERGLAMINTMPAYDAVFIDPRGKVYYSDGLTTPAHGEQ